MSQAIELRDTTPNDYEALADLFRTAYPHDPPPATETIKWLFERGDPARPNCRVVAVAGNRIVGSGYLRGAPPLPNLLVNVEVDPGYRRRGIGTRLLQAVDAAGGRTQPTLMMISEIDRGSLEFANRHGFVERDRQSESRLELASFDPARFAAALAEAAANGIQFRTLAEADAPTVRQRLFALANQVTQDMPSKDPMPPMDHDAFVGSWLEAPHSRHDLLVIGFDGAEPVAVSLINVLSSGDGYNWMTGVAPTHRGRGLGLAVKVEALRRAKEAGLSEVRTDNHTRNAPMLAINRRLGYQALPAIVWLVRDP